MDTVLNGRTPEAGNDKSSSSRPSCSRKGHSDVRWPELKVPAKEIVRQHGERLEARRRVGQTYSASR